MDVSVNVAVLGPGQAVEETEMEQQELFLA